MGDILIEMRDWDIPVTNIVGVKTVKRGALEDAFRRVCDPVAWKNPIDKTIPISELTPYDLALISEAIVFFAGCHSVMNINTVEKTVRIQAEGYYSAVGA